MISVPAMTSLLYTVTPPERGTRGHIGADGDAAKELVSHQRDSLEFQCLYGEQSSLLTEWHRRSVVFLKCLDAYLSSGETTREAHVDCGSHASRERLRMSTELQTASCPLPVSRMGKWQWPPSIDELP